LYDNEYLFKKLILINLLNIMEALPDPLDDRVMKTVLPPPQKPLSKNKLFPKKSNPTLTPRFTRLEVTPRSFSQRRTTRKN
jgi:hypothetical protein